MMTIVVGLNIVMTMAMSWLSVLLTITNEVMVGLPVDWWRGAHGLVFGIGAAEYLCCWR